MPSEIKTTCDICGAEKKKTNRWFLATTPSKGKILTIRHWTASKALIQGSQSLCGHGCVHVVTDRFLATFTTKAVVKTVDEPIEDTPAQDIEETPMPIREETTEIPDELL
jgi:hypothetical protein